MSRQIWARTPELDHEVCYVQPGEFVVSDKPSVVSTTLGSCVAACVRDKQRGIGGMNHFLLTHPTWSDAELAASARYGCFAMEMLLNEIYRRGGERANLEVKVFGGGHVHSVGLDVGQVNAHWILEYAEREQLQVCGSDLGGEGARRIFYYTDSGRVLVKRLASLDPRGAAAEDNYSKTIAARTRACDVTLF